MKAKNITGIKVEGFEFITIYDRAIDKIERVEYPDRGTWYRVLDNQGRFDEFNSRYVVRIVYDFEK